MIWCSSVSNFKEKRGNTNSSIQQIQKKNEEASTQNTWKSNPKPISLAHLISACFLIGLTLFCQVEGGPLTYKRQTRSPGPGPGRLPDSESIIFFQDDDSSPYHHNNRKPVDSSSRITSKLSASSQNVNQNTELFAFPPDVLPTPMDPDVRGNFGGLSDRLSRISTNKDIISFVDNEYSPPPSQIKSDSDGENDKDGHTSDHRFGIEFRASILDVPEYPMAEAGIHCENGELVQFFERMICNSNSKRSSANYSYMRRNKPLVRTRRMHPLIVSSS